MSNGIWTVEGPFWNDAGALTERWQTWAVMDEDGSALKYFPTKEQAEDWIEFQMAAAEDAARGSDDRLG